MEKFLQTFFIFVFAVFSFSCGDPRFIEKDKAKLENYVNPDGYCDDDGAVKDDFSGNGNENTSAGSDGNPGSDSGSSEDVGSETNDDGAAEKNDESSGNNSSNSGDEENDENSGSDENVQIDDEIYTSDEDVPIEEKPAMPIVGEVIFTEIMFNPKSMTDSKGEYVELYNGADHRISLEGCKLGYVDEKMQDLGKIEMEAGSYMVLGKAAVEEFGDFPFYNYGGVSLLNSLSEDFFKLVCGDVVIDEVFYPTSSEYNGASASFSQAWMGEEFVYLFNDYEKYFCPSTTEIGNGDFGTPGEPNGICPQDEINDEDIN